MKVSSYTVYAGGSIGSVLFGERIDLETYGYDPEDPSDEVKEEATIVIPNTNLPLSQTRLHTLQAAVDPLVLTVAFSSIENVCMWCSRQCVPMAY